MIDERLISVGVEAIEFCAISTEVLQNAFTVCIMIARDKDTNEPYVLARGVSICSVSDNHVIKEGKNRAYGRAAKAAITKQSSGPINAEMDRWDLGTVLRQYKAKTQEKVEFFETYIKPELDNLGVPIRRIKQKRRGGVEIDQFLFDIPKTYPVELASQYFDYKSEYMPDGQHLSEFEITVLQAYDERTKKT